MAVPVNVNTERFQLYTGIAQMRITAINPTMSELIEMGIPAQKEPIYTKVEAGDIHKTRLELHFASAVPGFDFTARASFFTTYGYTNSGLHINRYGRFKSWDNNQQLPADYLKDDPTPKLAYVGEMDLMLALESLCQIKKGQEFFLDKRDELFYRGDVSELNDILTQAAQQTVQCLVGVQTNEGKHYQTVFRRMLTSWSNQPERLWQAYVDQVKYLRQNNKEIDTTYGAITESRFIASEFELKPYTIPASDATPGKPAAPAAPPRPSAPPRPGAPAGAAQAGSPQPIKGPDDNDLPF